MVDYINFKIQEFLINNLGFWKTKKALCKIGINLDKKTLLKRIKNLK